MDVISLFMALLSSRGISTPSLQAQGEQRRSSYFNNHRDMPEKEGVRSGVFWCRRRTNSSPLEVHQPLRALRFVLEVCDSTGDPRMHEGTRNGAPTFLA
ncbi:MAG: hypothetical protein USCAAHI_02070 [Beijerinckiaceae bacterium]|nr:MAG: hypothetical protein USCAAHI_02070 [Beijerinckiaceae bacterium]